MAPEERQLLVETAKTVVGLFEDRDDMVVAITAVILDLYRIDFQRGHQTKQEALSRLQMQRGELSVVDPKQRGVKFLDALIETLRSDKLDAATLLREPPAGSA
jgi:hypothetical protein